MKYNNKNIWTLFFLITLLTFAVTAFTGYSHWRNAKNNLAYSQENLTQVLANSSFTVIRQYENLIDLIGHSILDRSEPFSASVVQQTLDHYLEFNPSIAAFSLYDPQGELLTSSSNLQRSDEGSGNYEAKITDNLPPSTDSMRLDRSYFNYKLQKLIIPVKKIIRDRSGVAVAIISASLKEELVFDFLQQQNMQNKDQQIWLYRGLDNFLQLVPRSINRNLELYKTPLKLPLLPNLKEFDNKNPDSSFSQLKHSQQVISYVQQSSFDDKNLLTTSQFIPRYNLWVTLQTPADLALQLSLSSFFNCLVFLLVFISLLYCLFRSFANHCANTEQKMHFQADHDQLTQLYNKIYLSNKERELLSNKASGFSYLFIDFDHFKTINENYNYHIGDSTLYEIASRLKLLCANKELIIRYSGNEFIIISRVLEADKLQLLAEYLLQWLAKPYQIDAQNIVVDLNIGIAQYPRDADNLDDLRACAKLALHEAKSRRNSHCVYNPVSHSKYRRRNAIRQQIKTALYNREFTVLYQPQINNCGEVYGVEALTRWHNDSLGEIDSQQFIRIAEETGLIYDLGLFVLRQSMIDLKKVQQKLNLPIRLSLNISLKQFTHPSFYQDLMKIVQQCQFNPRQLTLELTERLNVENLTALAKLMAALKAEGLAISLDNFGAGFSNLKLLNSLPIDELKLDRTFVDKIVDQQPIIIIDNMLNFSKKLQFSIVAQGVETPLQKEKLSDWGCDLFQGHLFAAAMARDELIKFIGQGKIGEQQEPMVLYF
ncbi:MAG: hypothetical protein OFPI_28420 [Osedax symbiont Rs2]|nr:MAG: hypothetical protein OFPI_28420 [Osedax symbiont Rs2]